MKSFIIKLILNSQIFQSAEMQESMRRSREGRRSRIGQNQSIIDNQGLLNNSPSPKKGLQAISSLGSSRKSPYDRKNSMDLSTSERPSSSRQKHNKKECACPGMNYFEQFF